MLTYLQIIKKISVPFQFVIILYIMDFSMKCFFTRLIYSTKLQDNIPTLKRMAFSPTIIFPLGSGNIPIVDLHYKINMTI